MQDKSSKDLGSSLIETLGSSELPEIVQDIAEAALDSVLIDGIAKDIPIVGMIVRLGKAAFTIRDYFLIRKVLVFLQGMSETTHEQRQAFVSEIEADPKYQQRVGETIIMLLDRLDHIDKSRLIARVFSACVKGEIDYDEFLRISTAVERAFIGDLNDLLHYFSVKEISEAGRRRRNRTTRNVYTSNFSDFYVLTEEQAQESGLEHPQIYHFNQYAMKFARIILGDRFREGRW